MSTIRLGHGIHRKSNASYAESHGTYPCGDSDFAKILKFHDWIVKNVAYRLGAGYADYSVGALANRGAVCAGYAQCMQFLLEQEGIESIYICRLQTKKRTCMHGIWSSMRDTGFMWTVPGVAVFGDDRM